MKGLSDIPLILGRLRPSKQLTSTQVLSQCAARPGGIVQPINFSKTRWARALFIKCIEVVQSTAFKDMFTSSIGSYQNSMHRNNSSAQNHDMVKVISMINSY